MGLGRPNTAQARSRGGFARCFALCFALLVASCGPTETASRLAREVQPLILAEWQKLPELKDASIQQVELVHEGGNTYRGFVDATFGGAATRLGIEVIADQERVLWELHELDSPTEATESTEDAENGEVVEPGQPLPNGDVEPPAEATPLDLEPDSETNSEPEPEGAPGR